MHCQGVAAWYAYGCFPRIDHPDLVRYIQAIPEIVVFINHANDVIRYVRRIPWLRTIVSSVLYLSASTKKRWMESNTAIFR